MDPAWDPKKVPKLFSKVIFGGPKPSPPGLAELQISEKNVECFERKALFLGGGGPVQPSGGSLLGSPKNKNFNFGGLPKWTPKGSKIGPFGTPKNHPKKISRKL